MTFGYCFPTPSLTRSRRGTVNYLNASRPQPKKGCVRFKVLGYTGPVSAKCLGQSLMGSKPGGVDILQALVRFDSVFKRQLASLQVFDQRPDYGVSI